MRSTLSLLILLAVAVVLVQSTRRPGTERPGTRHPGTGSPHPRQHGTTRRYHHSTGPHSSQTASDLLAVMDQALESKNFKKFLSMHDPNFNFKFCDASGKSVDDLKKILETDPNMSQTVKSKHFVRGPVRKNSGGQYQFGYEEFLLLKNNELYKTQGSITMSDDFKVLSAKEKCPVKVF